MVTVPLLAKVPAYRFNRRTMKLEFEARVVEARFNSNVSNAEPLTIDKLAGRLPAPPIFNMGVLGRFETSFANDPPD